MKKIIFIISSTILFAINTQAENNQKVIKTLLDSANTAYVQKRYDAAADFYKKILDLGYIAPEIYYNLGNAYFKQNEITKAIYYYEKAQKLAPNDKDIKYNLEFANQYITDKIKQAPRFFIVKIVYKIADLFTTNGWAILAFTLFIIVLLSLLAFLFTKSISIKKASFYIGVISLIFSITSLYLSYLQYNRYARSNEAIVFAPTLTLKSSPDENGTDLMIIHEGLKVSVTDSLDNWYEIKLPDGNKGWTEKQNVKRI